MLVGGGAEGGGEPVIFPGRGLALTRAEATARPGRFVRCRGHRTTVGGREGRSSERFLSVSFVGLVKRRRKRQFLCL